ncbi:MAG: hypothetical protein M0P26_00285 [Bacteroidales bacterium]|nr:hypothetical protein [Bacteroidales bacterium]
MDSKNRLRHELTELNLLLSGLAKIPAFPKELFELISDKVESISLLAMQNEKPRTSNEPELFPEGLFNSDRNPCDHDHDAKPDLSYFEVITSKSIPTLVPDNKSAEDIDTPLKTAGKGRFVTNVTVGRINDQMEQKRMSDLGKSLTLNDRFRFQKEFFENDPLKMAEALSVINETLSAEEALDYLREVYSVDEQSDCFHDFCMMLNLHFANVSGIS